MFPVCGSVLCGAGSALSVGFAALGPSLSEGSCAWFSSASGDSWAASEIVGDPVVFEGCTGVEGCGGHGSLCSWLGGRDAVPMCGVAGVYALRKRQFLKERRPDRRSPTTR